MKRRTMIRVLLICVALIAIGVVTVMWINSSNDDEYSLSEQKVALEDKVSVDFSDNADVLTPAQQSKLQEDLLLMSTKEAPKDTAVTATIRKSSIQRTSDKEVMFIIDSAQLQTSYLVSRFVSVEDNLDIVNIGCVEENEKIYDQDYCYVE